MRLGCCGGCVCVCVCCDNGNGNRNGNKKKSWVFADGRFRSYDLSVMSR